MNKEKEGYCDWRYILCWLAWTVIFFYPEWGLDKLPNPVFAGIVLWVVWLLISFWIIDQGEKHSRCNRGRKND